MKTTIFLLSAFFLFSGSLKMFNSGSRENENGRVSSSGYYLNASSPLYYMAAYFNPAGEDVNNILLKANSPEASKAENTLLRLALEVGASLEPEREIESWMTDYKSWGLKKEVSPLALPAEYEESTMSIENWMITPDEWTAPAEMVGSALNAEFSADEVSQVENWMITPSLWATENQKTGEALSFMYDPRQEFDLPNGSRMTDPFKDKWEDAPIESWMTDPKSWITK